MAITIGTGATLTFGGHSLNLTSLSMTGGSRESIETTHLGTGSARTFLEDDLYDPGSIECEFQLDDAPNTTDADIENMLGLAAAGFTVQMDASEGKWTGTAFATDVSWTMPVGELATGSLTLKITGAITTADV